MKAKILIPTISISVSLMALCAVGADPMVELSTDFAGASLKVVANDGPVVEVMPDLRGGGRWFYWYFEAKALQAGEVTFQFPQEIAGFKNGAVGFQGPAVSEDCGETWRWRGSNEAFSSADSFRWKFTEMGETVRFAVAIPYLEQNLRSFLKRHRDNPHLKSGVLTETRMGREVELLQVGEPGEGRVPMLITARHHACETIASYLLEGLLEAAIADDAEGRRFRDTHVLYVVPFVDKDGVELGDQGKNRFPHDHNRDYDGEPLYASVKAIKELAEEKQIRALLDLHCPTLVMDIHQRFYFVGPSDFPPGNEERVKAFAENIEQLLPEGAPAGPVVQLTPSDAKRAKHCSGYFSRLQGARFSATLETPFSPKKTAMEADDVRAYGRAILAAWNRTWKAD